MTAPGFALCILSTQHSLLIVCLAAETHGNSIVFDVLAAVIVAE